MTTELTIERMLINCLVCGGEFWFEWENKTQECSHCGQRNSRQAILLGINGGGYGLPREGEGGETE